jgi:hypothetical protein
MTEAEVEKLHAGIIVLAAAKKKGTVKQWRIGSTGSGDLVVVEVMLPSNLVVSELGRDAVDAFTRIGATLEKMALAGGPKA